MSCDPKRISDVDTEAVLPVGNLSTWPVVGSRCTGDVADTRSCAILECGCGPRTPTGIFEMSSRSSCRFFGLVQDVMLDVRVRKGVVVAVQTRMSAASCQMALEGVVNESGGAESASGAIEKL